MNYMFGGSFDPFTKAHLFIVEFLLKNYLTEETDKLYIVPNGNHYHFNDKELTSFKIRKEMIDSCVKSSKVEVLDIEDSDSFNGIYQTLRKLNHPIYVIGSDLLYTITTWKEAESLLKENHFLIIPRENYLVNEAFLKDHFLNKFKNHFKTADIILPNISSSRFRKEKMKDDLPANVLKVIQKYQLY